MLQYELLKSGKFIISGPCVIENENLLFEVAEKMVYLTKKYNLTYIFKASYDKANRTSINSFRGPGIEKGLDLLDNVKRKFDIPITSDVHDAYECKLAGEVLDIIQIPAFLCRQTDLLVAAAKTSKIVNVKKAQFLDGKDMINVVRKIEESGNRKILLTERGSMFGLGNLVVDFRQIIDMQKFGYPIVMDVTHSCQKPGGLGDKSGGNREYSFPFTKLANSIGVNGFFIEVHPNPDIALSDGPNMVFLDEIHNYLDYVGNF